MNSMKFCCAALSCLILISCQPHYTKDTRILRAEALLASDPANAERLLASIPHPEKLSKADYAAWCLVSTQVKIKLRKEVLSDSLILTSVNYYKKSGLLKQAGTAYYLLGYFNRTHQKNKEAMGAYKHADFYLRNTEENKLKGLLNYYMGDICMEDELNNYALMYYKKSLAYLKLSKDQNLQAYDYRQISNMYHMLDYPVDSVMLYSNLALKYSKAAGDSVNYNNILARQGELLYNSNFKLSNQYVRQGYRFFPDQRSYYAAYLAYTYSMIHEPDSARYYLNISLSDSSNTKTKVISYLAGAYLERNEGNQKMAFGYLEKAFVYRDSAFQKSIRSQLYRIDKQYDLTKKEEENAALKIDNQRKVIVIGLLVIVVLVLLIVFLMVSSRYRKKQAEHRMETQRLEFILKAKQAENDLKRDLLLSKLQSRIENTLQLNRLSMGLMKHEKLDDFVKELSTQSILSETDWQYYIREVDSIFDGKLSALPETHPQLTRPDMIVITLISLQMDISDCCSLLNMKKNAMYHRRNIIKERLGILQDTDLEDWLSAYLTP